MACLHYEDLPRHLGSLIEHWGMIPTTNNTYSTTWQTTNKNNDLAYGRGGVFAFLTEHCTFSLKNTTIMFSRSILLVAVAAVALLANGASAFTAPLSQNVESRISSKRSMVPKFDASTERWEATTDEDLEDGYGIIETIVRNGPLPFFQRIINADAYEQSVLKYMATAKVGRKEAQGNMDASLENQADWAYQKVQESKGAPKKDYAKSPSPKQFALAGTWYVGVISLLHYCHLFLSRLFSSHICLKFAHTIMSTLKVIDCFLVFRKYHWRYRRRKVWTLLNKNEFLGSRA